MAVSLTPTDITKLITTVTKVIDDSMLRAWASESSVDVASTEMDRNGDLILYFDVATTRDHQGEPIVLRVSVTRV